MSDEIYSFQKGQWEAYTFPKLVKWPVILYTAKNPLTARFEIGCKRTRNTNISDFSETDFPVSRGAEVSRMVILGSWDLIYLTRLDDNPEPLIVLGIRGLSNKDNKLQGPQPK